ncbi:MAG: Asp-tRNA(Asn)/Glu-tRNA(Gln) amidotransferase subunit GatC [Bacteroidota bacterium]
MSVTKKDVEYIASLARLKFEEAELDNFTHQLNDILAYVEKLNELDTKNIEPLSHPIENNNVFRKDELHPSTLTKEALKNAPDKTEEYFRVPKVINQ